MALKLSLEKNGIFLFRYRGQIPLFVFILGLPFIYFQYFTDNYNCFIGKQGGIFWLVITIISVIISLLGICVRAYTIGTTPRGTSGRNTKQQVAKQLNTKGIYSIVRHPLYVGNYLMWAGLLIFTANIYLFIIASLLYWIYYERIMYVEECHLEKQFGDVFFQWSTQVPAFIPSFKKYKKSDITFSIKTVLRREYSGLFAITLCFVVVDYIRYFAHYVQHDLDSVCWLRWSLFYLLFVGIITLTLRSLKHYTTILNKEKNRD